MVYVVDDFLTDTARQKKVHLITSFRRAGTLAGAVYNILRRLRRQFREET